MFSRTTMASSIRIPIASERPSSDIVFNVKPKAHTAMKEASTLTGSARPVMTVERQELRKRNTTSTVSSAPSISASLHVPHRVVHPQAGVLHDLQLHPRRHALLQRGDPPVNHVGHLSRAVALGLEDLDADGLAAVERGESPALLGAVAHLGDLAQPDDLAVPLRHDQPLEVRGRVEPPLEPDGALLQRAVEPPDRRGQVLRLERLHHLGDADACRLHRDGLDLDRQLPFQPAHDAHLGHPGHGAQFADDHRDRRSGSGRRSVPRTT